MGCSPWGRIESDVIEQLNHHRLLVVMWAVWKQEQDRETTEF